MITKATFQYNIHLEEIDFFENKFTLERFTKQHILDIKTYTSKTLNSKTKPRFPIA